MKKLLIALFVLLMTLVIALPGLAGDRSQEYTIAVVDYPGATWTQMSAINNQGKMLGIYGTEQWPGSFILRHGQYTPVEVPGAVFTIAEGMNDRGDIVGWYLTDTYAEPGFLLDKHGNLTTLEVPGSVWTEALDINNRGTIVGRYGDGGFPRGFIYRDGTYEYPIDIVPPDRTLPPGSTWLEGINDHEQIAGVATNGTSYSKAFIMEPDGTLSWYVPTLADDSTPGMGFFGLNNNGKAVGTAIAGTPNGLVYTAWLMDRGEDVLFFNVPNSADSWITGINDSGNMVGYFYDNDGNRHGLVFSKSPSSQLRR